MDTPSLILLIFCLMLIAYYLGRSKSIAQAANLGGIERLHSLPFYYGVHTAVWAGVPAVSILLLWLAFDTHIIRWIIVSQLPADVVQANQDEISLFINKIYNVAYGDDIGFAPPFIIEAADMVKRLERYSHMIMTSAIIAMMFITGGLMWMFVKPNRPARKLVETNFRNVLFVCAFVAVITTVAIVFSIIVESLRFFDAVPITDFLFGLQWSPQSAEFGEGLSHESHFGMVPLIVGTVYIAAIAMLVALPVGLMTAIYLSEYASQKVRTVVKPMLEVLAGIPTVVYGFFAALTVGPRVREVAIALGLDRWLTVTAESALAVGLVMGIMIIPFISSLSDDVLRAVPRNLRDGALALGSTRSEVVKRVVIPAALPGVVGGFLLAVSRALGETMIVVMAAGMAANLTMNPLDSMTTITVQIVSLLVGDQEFDSPKTLVAFALGLLLFAVTLCLNYFALRIVKRYREKYE